MVFLANSNVELSYYFDDYSFTKGEYNYYRLSQTDYNGVREYFNIVAIFNSTDNKCNNPVYFDLFGNEIDYSLATPGMYLRKCGTKVEKVVKIIN